MLARRTGFYGYTIVLGSFAALLLITGSFYALAVGAGTMAKDLGWTASQFSLAFSIYMLTGLAAPLYGAIIQRWGPRYSIIAGSVLSAAGWITVATTHSLAQFYLGVALMGPGMWMGGNIPAAQLVGNWFSRRRTLMMGLTITAPGFGGMLYANSTQAMLTGFGSWRTTWFIMAGLLALPGIIAALVIRDRPDELGQEIDGGAHSPPPVATPPRGARTRSQNYRTDRQWEIGAILRTRTAWLMMAAMGTLGFALSGMITHQVNYFRDELLMSPALAAAAAGLVSFASIAGRVFSGWLGARIPVRFAMAFFSALLGGSLAVLALWRNPLAVLVYALMFGPGWGGMMIIPNAAYMDYFGTKNFARLSGIALGLQCILQGTAPVLIGSLRDQMGSYVPGFALTSALVMVGVVAALMAVPPFPREQSSMDLPAPANSLELA